MTATYHSGDYNNYSVDISWPLVDGADSYNVKLTTNSTDTTFINETSPYTRSGLSIANGETYIFSVQAVNSLGGSSAYSSASVSLPTVGTAGVPVSGIDSSFINYADITLTGSNSGPFYKITTTPNAGADPTTLADSWTTSTYTTSITCTINNLITNFNYTLFTITAYNIAGAVSSTSETYSAGFKATNNFMFSYTTSHLPPLGTTSGGDANQQQREGIFNYLPFFYGTSVAATGTLTLSTLLYTTSNYITWTGVGPYTVNISFPEFESNGTPLWEYKPRTTTPTTGTYMAGTTCGYDYQSSSSSPNNMANIYYRTNCTLLSFNNFGSIPLASYRGAFTFNESYVKTLIITNNSIPIIAPGSSLILVTYIKPDSASSLHISNWDISNVIVLTDLFYSCDFRNAPSDVDISKWKPINVTFITGMFRVATFKNPTTMYIDWNVPNLTTNMIKLFQGSNFNTPFKFTFSNTANIDMSQMFATSSEFNQSLNSWDVSRVVNMSSMFQGATAFNNGETGNTGNAPLIWNTNTTIVTNMSSMFLNATKFNQNITSWNVSTVTNMASMFENATAFNMSLNNWNPVSVANMSSMFKGATSFNNGYTSSSAIVIPLTWVNPFTSVANATNMNSMFENASTFNNGCPTNNASNPMNYGPTQWILPLHPSHTNFGTNSKLFPSNSNGNADPFKLPEVLNSNFDNTSILADGAFTEIISSTAVPNWNFDRGILSNNSSVWAITPYPLPGTYCVALQVATNSGSQYNRASISQNIKFGIGTYTLSWYSAPRQNQRRQVDILIDSGVIYSYTPPLGTNVWATYTCTIPITTSNEYTLTIRANQVDPSDNTTSVKGFTIT